MKYLKDLIVENAHRRRETRENLYKRYDGRCAYCNVETSYKAGTVDHYLPKVMGGKDDRENLRWSCWTCNHLKANMSPEEWEMVKPSPVPTVETAYERKVRLQRMVALRRLEIERRNACE